MSENITDIKSWIRRLKAEGNQVTVNSVEDRDPWHALRILNEVKDRRWWMAIVEREGLLLVGRGSVPDVVAYNALKFEHLGTGFDTLKATREALVVLGVAKHVDDAASILHEHRGHLVIVLSRLDTSNPGHSHF